MRSRHTDNPVIHLELFRVNDFRWANAAMLVYAVGFNAMFLGNIFFLTRAWRYSILRAGMAVSLGPIVVATTAPFFGRLAGRIGQKRLLVPGGLVWGAGGAWLLTRASLTPDYVRVYLPATLITGLGVSLCLPQLSSAAVRGLPSDHYATGSAVVQSLRNLGGTFGVALVIAFTEGATRATTMTQFHHVWWLLLGCGLAVTVLSSRLTTKPARARAGTIVGLAVE